MANSGGWAVRAGWVAVIIGPPAVAAALLRHLVAAHFATAVVLGLVYEGVVGGSRFVGGVVGELATRWRERLVERIDLMLQQKVSGFGLRYREFVLADVRFIDQRDLSTVGYFTPELDEVFVDVSLTFRAPHKVQGALLSGDMPTDVTERHALGEFLDRREPEVLAVIGPPGSGKTTLLRHTARQVCLTRRHRRRRVPILLYLRDHVAEIVAQPGVGVADLIRGRLGQTGAGEPVGWFERRLRNGDCVVLLDGLDEVARQEDRENVAAWVQRQIRQHSRNDYVVTSRPHGYRSARIDGASVLQVRDFSADQVARFVRNWYMAVARYDADAASKTSRQRAESAADDLLRRLDDAPALRDLTVNPLLLTMIVNVHRYGGNTLPSGRAELYAEICQVVLWRRQEVKKLTSDLIGFEKEVVLRGLAYTMMQRRLRDLPRGDVLAEIGLALERGSHHVTAEDFLTDVGSNGLLVERENGQYRFAHQTFQEYLAAAHIRDNRLADVLAKNVGDSWWLEVTLLYAAQADADPIVLACLDSGSVNAVTLAFHCADQGSELSPDIHARLEDLINSASAPGADPERRRLIAGVLLARHLRQRVRTSGGVYVCSRPITMTLYRAFLDDSQYPGPDSPMPEKLDDKTASGMRASDAAAFVGWVNGIVGGGTVYRLPSRAEIDDMVGRQRFASAGPISASHPSVWLSPVPDLWVPSGTPHPHLLAGGTLAIHVVEDFSGWVPTLTRLQLLRALIAVRGLVRDLDHARRLFLNRSEASPLVRDQALHDIGGACARIRTRADALISTLSRPNALDLGRCSRLAAAIQDSVPAVFRNDDLNDRLDRNKDRADSLARARSRALDLASIIDHALQQDLSRAGTLDHTLGLDTDHGTGKALSHALSEALDTIAITREWPTAFSDAFIKSCDISRNSYMASPDTLTDKVNTLAETLGVMTRTVPSGQTTPSAWMVEVSRRLQRTAIPVFGRQVPLTPAAATSIRLAALCLAAEAEGFADNSVGETFREIAAGVTLLERRASGKAPPTETILLATS